MTPQLIEKLKKAESVLILVATVPNEEEET